MMGQGGFDLILLLGNKNLLPIEVGLNLFANVTT